MKEARPPYWRTVKFTSSLVQIHVGSLIGSRDILSQMGYTEDIDDGVSFPLNVTEPDVQKLRELAPDLFFARYEIDALLVNSHPYYEITPPVPESEVQLPTLLRTTFSPSKPQRFPPRTSSTPLSVPQQATAVSVGSTTTVVTSPARTVLPYIRGNQPQQRTPSTIPAARRQRGNLSDRKVAYESCIWPVNGVHPFTPSITYCGIIYLTDHCTNDCNPTSLIYSYIVQLKTCNTCNR